MPSDVDAGLNVLISNQLTRVLDKQEGMGEKLAGISEQIRQLENLPARVRDLELKMAEDKGAKDNWARIFSILSALVAIASVVAVFVRS
jgi:hypothetical protein